MFSSRAEVMFRGLKMELKELQKQIIEIVDEIDTKLGVVHDSESTFNHIVEELGEVANQLNKPKIRREEMKINEFSDEIADVLILITKLADIHGIEIEKSILNKIDKLKMRHNL